MTDLAHFSGGLRQIISDTDLSNFNVTALPGGASSREYFRVDDGDRRWVVMVLADEPIRSEEAMSGPRPGGIPFVDIGQFLAQSGVSVPRIHLVDEAMGHIWLDDLGDTHLLHWLEQGGNVTTGYHSALRLLTVFQQATRLEPVAAPYDELICFRRQFEADLLHWELEHWLEWRVDAQLGVNVSEQVKAALDDGFRDLVATLESQPQRLVHRDFQSTNLMLTNASVTTTSSKAAIAPRLALIDFQDALFGSWTYDLVALLRDSYVDLSKETVDRLIDDYLEMAFAAGLLNDRPNTSTLRQSFKRQFHQQTVQRKLKDAGRFVYIDRVKGNDRYLQYIPRTMRFVRESVDWLLADGQTHFMPTLADALRQVDPESFA